MKRYISVFAAIGLHSVAFAADVDVADAGDEADAAASSRRLPKPELAPNLPDFDLNSRDFIFPSGLRIILQADHSQPVVAVTGTFDRGSSADPVGKEGIAHFVEHLWFKSRHGDLPRTWDVLSEMGCDLNAYTALDETVYMTVCPNSALKPLLRLESLRMTEPVIGVVEGEVTSEREVIRNELRMRYENGGGESMRYIMDRLYGPEHPYHRLGIGTHGSLDNINLADIQEFTRTNYRPENVTIMVVGDFDIEEASSLIFENFAPEVLHPRMTAEHMRWYPRGDVAYEDLDPENPDPDQILWTAVDPDDTNEPFRVLQTPPDRRSTFGMEPPPPYNQEVGVFDAPVDDRQVIVAWTAPGAWKGGDTVANVASGVVSNALANHFYGDPYVRTAEGTSFPEVGCFPWGAKENTAFLCFATITEDANGERIGERMIDQMMELYNPEILGNPTLRTAYENSFILARNEGYRDVILSLDLFSSLGGRATSIANHAHYTGSARFHTDTMQELSQLNYDKVAEYIKTWLTRDRATMVVLNPIPDDELTLDNSESAYAGATRDSDLVVSALPADAITPELLREEMVLPDLSKVRETTLSNGLRVVVMPHGEAPVVEAHLIVRGGPDVDLLGLDDFVDAFTKDPAFRFPTPPDLDPLKVAGEFYDWDLGTYSTIGMRAPSGNLDGALYMTRQRVDGLAPSMEGRGSYIKRLRRNLVRNWKDDDYWVSELPNQVFGADHPAFHSRTWEDIDALDELRAGDIRAYLDRKYQPDAATLLIVGNIDADEALRQAETYFGTWEAHDPTAEPIDNRVPPAPIQGSPTVFLVNVDRRTQTDVSLTCRLADGSAESGVARNVLGTMLSDHLFEELRAREGITYGAYAGDITSMPIGTAGLRMGGLIQNDGVAIALDMFRQTAQAAANGDFPANRFAPTRLNVARTYRLNQQSVGQMTSRIMRPLGEGLGWNSITDRPDQLVATDYAELQRLAAPCPDTAVVTMHGPVDVIAPILDEAGVTYEVVDVEQRALALLDQYSPKDAKKYRKYLEEKAEAEAEEAAEEAASESEGETTAE
jgi:zinc protease